MPEKDLSTWYFKISMGVSECVYVCVCGCVCVHAWERERERERELYCMAQTMVVNASGIRG